MNAVGRCITGKQRKNNEDAILIAKDIGVLKNLYIVADGMGGHNAGEVASSLAIEAFQEYLTLHSHIEYTEEDVLDALVGAAQYANGIVFERAQTQETLSGMGTTLLAVSVCRTRLYAAHVGDSRLYLYRNGTLQQMTRDHSFVMEMVKQGKLTLEEAQNHPNKNVITRSLGTDAAVDIDTVILELEKDDVAMLCTDGLTNMVPEAEICQILSGGLSLAEQVEELTVSADRNGGLDNISVILMKQEVL